MVSPIRTSDELLDVGDDVADLADPQLVAGDLAGPEPAQADDLVLGPAGHQPDLLADLDRAVDDPDVDDDALVVVELRVEDQGPERGLRVAGRRRDPLDDRPEQLGDARPGLAADGQDLVGVDAQACCMISSLISSGRAACMSILFSTGTMARSPPMAR